MTKPALDPVPFSRFGSRLSLAHVRGAGLCDPAYTWTASVFLLLAEHLSKA